MMAHHVIHHRANHRHHRIAAYESSSLSAPAFARQCGVKYPTFAAWIAAHKRSKPARKCPPAFLVAEVAAEIAGNALEVRLPGGAIARASDPEQIRLLATLLRQLA